MATIPNLLPPGIIVNQLKGDAMERRAHGWLGTDPSQREIKLAILGVPFDGASTVRAGSRHAPDSVRAMLKYYTTFSSGTGKDMFAFNAADLGDVQVVVTDMDLSFQHITDSICEIIRAGIHPVCIGGDHSISWPIVEGIYRARPGQKLGIIHFDTHHDLRESHFGARSSGIPFRKILEMEGQPVTAQNMVQIGMGEFANSPLHHNFALDSGITVIPLLELRRVGMVNAIERALNIATDGTDAVYISIDVDCIDQSQAPGTASPNPYGLDARDLYEAVYQMAQVDKVVGLDIVEISPPLDINDMTANVGAMLVLNFFLGVTQRDSSDTHA